MGTAGHHMAIAFAIYVLWDADAISMETSNPWAAIDLLIQNSG